MGLSTVLKKDASWQAGIAGSYLQLLCALGHCGRSMNVAIAKLFSFPGTQCIPWQKSLSCAAQPEGRKSSKVWRAKEAEWKMRCRRDWEGCGKKSLRVPIVDSWAYQRKGLLKKTVEKTIKTPLRKAS